MNLKNGFSCLCSLPWSQLCRCKYEWLNTKRHQLNLKIKKRSFPADAPSLVTVMPLLTINNLRSLGK